MHRPRKLAVDTHVQTITSAVIKTGKAASGAQGRSAANGPEAEMTKGPKRPEALSLLAVRVAAG